MKSLKRLFFILLVLTCGAMPALAQGTVNIKGRVFEKDTLTPLQGAVVLVGDGRKYNMSTNEKGEFTLRNVTKEKITLVATFVGLPDVTKEVDLTPRNIRGTYDAGNFVMAGAVQLDALVFQGEPPLAVQKGDTTEFMAEAIKVNQDATAEDLVKKLPGAEVSNGSIKVNGEEVRKITLDGKQMTGTISEILQDLPADMISSIGMFDDQSDMSKFSGFDDGTRERTLNLRTYNPKEIKYDVRASAGYGIEDTKYDGIRSLYAGSINGTVKNDRHDLTGSLLANNTGGGIGRFNQGRYGGGSGLNTIENVNLRYTGTINPKTTLSFGYEFRDLDNELVSSTTRDYMKSDNFDTRTTYDELVSGSNTTRHEFNARLENKGDSFRYTIRPSFSINNGDGRSHTLGGTIQDNDSINKSDRLSNYDNKSYSAQLRSEFMWKLSQRGNTLSIGLDGSYSNSDNRSVNVSANASRDEFGQWVPENLDQLAKSSQDTKAFGASVSYSEPLSQYSALALNYNINNNNSNSDKYTGNRQGDGSYMMDTTLTNDTDRKYLTNQFGLGYSFNKEDFRFSARINYQYATRGNDEHLNIAPYERDARYHFSTVLPSANIRYKKGSQTFEANYRTETQFPSVTELQDILDNTNPLRVSKGNPNLKQSYTNNLWLSYQSVNPAKSTMFGLNARISLNSNYITDSTRFLQADEYIDGILVLRGAQYSTPTNLDGYRSANLRGMYSFPIRPIKCNLFSGLFLNYERRPSIYDGVRNVTNNNSGTAMFRLSSNISKNVDFNISSGTTYSYAQNSIKDNVSSFRQSVNGGFVITFPWSIVLGADYSFSYNTSSQTEMPNKNTQMFNMSLGKKLFRNQMGELTLAAYDILRQNSSLNYTITDNYLQTSYSNILGNYYMLTFSYRFRSYTTAGGSTSQGDRMMRGSGGGYGGGEYRGSRPPGM